MNICKSDIRNLILWLDDAAELYSRTSSKPKDANRARLIKKLSKKLKSKMNGIL